MVGPRALVPYIESAESMESIRTDVAECEAIHVRWARLPNVELIAKQSIAASVQAITDGVQHHMAKCGTALVRDVETLVKIEQVAALVLGDERRYARGRISSLGQQRHRNIYQQLPALVQASRGREGHSRSYS